MNDKCCSRTFRRMTFGRMTNYQMTFGRKHILSNDTFCRRDNWSIGYLVKQHIVENKT